MGSEVDHGITFEEALAMTEGHKLSPPLAVPIVKNLAVGTTFLADLPLDEVFGAKLHQWVDVVHPFTENPDLKELEITFMANDYKSLPGMIGLKAECSLPFTMQCFIVNNPDDTKTLLKFCRLQGDSRLLVDTIKGLCHGFLMRINYGTKYAAGTKALQFILERLPGFQVRYHTVTTAGTPKRNTEQSSLEKGFEYIKLNGPKTNIDNKATEFAEKECEKVGGQLFGWNKGLVERSCLNYGKGMAAARRKSFHHRTLRDVNGWMLNLLALCIGFYRTETFMFIGESGLGKSPLGKVLGMLFSFMNIIMDGVDVEVGYRHCNDFEHLRHEPGTKYHTEVFDDGKLREQDAARVKTFQDNTEEESRTVEKYTTTCMIAHSGRITINNPYDESRFPAQMPDGTWPKTVSAKAFYEALSPSLHKDMDQKNFYAIAKRSTQIIFGKHGVLMRRANEEEVDVPFYAYPAGVKPDIFEVESKARYGLWKGNVSAPAPDNYKEDMEWSIAFLKVCMSDRLPPRVVQIGGPQPFNGDQGEQTIKHIKPTLLELEAALLGPQTPHIFRKASSVGHLVSVSPWGTAGGPSANETALPRHEPTGPAPTFCGVAEDWNEMQRILHEKTVRAGLQHATVDLITPPSSPTRARPAAIPVGFCGDTGDFEAVNKILGALMEPFNHQTISCLSEDEAIHSPPRSLD